MITMAIIQLLMSKGKELEDLEELKSQQKNCIIRGLKIRVNPEVFLREKVEKKLVIISQNGREIIRIVGFNLQLSSILELFARKVQ